MESFSALLAICAGNSAVTGEFCAQRPVTRSFDVLFDVRLIKRLCKQSWGWWFEQSPGRQMRPMSPPGDPRPCHRWSVCRPIDSLGFAENVLEWNWRDNSADALISNVHCALSKWGSCLVHFDNFWLVAWYQQIIDWRTTQNWDGPPNHQP